MSLRSPILPLTSRYSRRSRHVCYTCPTTAYSSRLQTHPRQKNKRWTLVLESCTIPEAYLQRIHIISTRPTLNKLRPPPLLSIMVYNVNCFIYYLYIDLLYINWLYIWLYIYIFTKSHSLSQNLIISPTFPDYLPQSHYLSHIHRHIQRRVLYFDAHSPR